MTLAVASARRPFSAAQRQAWIRTVDDRGVHARTVTAWATAASTPSWTVSEAPDSVK